MQLFFAAASPFVRKVMVLAIERGIDGRIEKLAAAAHPINQDAKIKALNPTGKVPTLIADDGQAIYDSRVICEYLDTVGEGPSMFPAAGKARWDALVLQSAADEMLDAALLARYEAIARPEPLRWSDWTAGNMRKIDDTLDFFAGPALAHLETRLDIGTIAAACALGYLDFRFAAHDWRAGRPKLAAWFEVFSARPSMTATMPA